MILVVAVLIGAASYRLWRLAALDQITEPLRAPIVASERPVVRWLADGLLCPWCLGAWIVAAMTLLWSSVVGFESWVVAVAVGAAASAVTGMLGRVDT